MVTFWMLMVATVQIQQRAAEQRAQVTAVRVTNTPRPAYLGMALRKDNRVSTTPTPVPTVAPTPRPKAARAEPVAAPVPTARAVAVPVEGIISCHGRKASKGSNDQGNVGLGQELAAGRGWTGEQWVALLNLWTCESTWHHTRAYGRAYGIPQALPGSKMASHGGDWRTNPATQIRWGLDYIAGRYGTPLGAWGHFQRKNWY